MKFTLRAALPALLALYLPALAEDAAGDVNQPQDTSQCRYMIELKGHQFAYPACKKEAEEGNAEAQSDLAWMYYSGRGVGLNKSEAVKWYHKAAEQGNVNAQTNLGVLYTRGDGVELDKKKAAAWFRKAAEQDDPTAQANLGVIYQKGLGVPRDMDKAIQWLRRAAEQEHTEAQFILGTIYDAGIDVPEDNAEAVQWLRKAAEQGHTLAQYELGVMYVMGQEGIDRDVQEGYIWLYLAVHRGFARAINLMYLAEDQLSWGEVSEAEEEAARRQKRYAP